MIKIKIYWVFIGLFWAFSLQADELRIAVASNFAQPMKKLAERFERDTGHRVLVSTGSTGKHFAQISQGAPFDAFFAADVDRPQILEDAGVAVPGSRFTYATGRLVLWSPNKELVDERGDVLKTDQFRFIALANPMLAPYGFAAKQVMQSKGVWEKLQTKSVRGENIGQAYQFVKSGNADLGFVAYSQIKQADGRIAGSYWIVPRDCYQTIEQQAVVLKESAAVDAFMSFVKSAEVSEIIRDFGYIAPNVE